MLVTHLQPHDLADPWAPYVPSDAAPWNLARVVHLHRRTGFAATWAEIERDLRDGPEASVTRVLRGKAHVDGVMQDFDGISAALADSAASSSMADRLKAWWVFRMLFSPDPLGERLTLMWHNHFATSNAKVNDLSAMRRQNDIFRDYARAPFGELLTRVLKDAAMLDWLDASANRKEHPNENLSRESMELFTLGVGHYSEADVKQGARALTGWSFKPDGFHEFAQYHDDGEKTILGRKGRWRGDDFLAMLLEHPATSVRLARRLCELFLGETPVGQAASLPVRSSSGNKVVPSEKAALIPALSRGEREKEPCKYTVDELIDSLAAGLRAHRLDIGWGVERILRSKTFFATSNIRNRVLSPPEFVIGAARALEQFDPPPSTLLLAEWIARIGQDLFYPPNVFGWPGGRTWINSRSLVARINFASSLVDGSVRYPAAPSNILSLVERSTGSADPEHAMHFLSRLLLGTEPPKPVAREIEKAAQSSRRLSAEGARRIAACLIASPEGQAG